MIRVSVETVFNELVLDEMATAVEKGVKQTAYMVAGLARATAPVKTGKLRQSIRVHKSTRVPQSYAIIMGGGDQYYATFIAQGTPGKTKKLKLKGPKFSKGDASTGYSKSRKRYKKRRNLRKEVPRTPIAANEFLQLALRKMARKRLVKNIKRHWPQ